MSGSYRHREEPDFPLSKMGALRASGKQTSELIL